MIRMDKIADTLLSMAGEKKTVLGESAVCESAIDNQTEYGLENPDLIVSAKSIKTYHDMRLDDALGAYLNMKKRARLSTKWMIKPASDEQSHQRHAEFIRHIFVRIPGSLKEKIYEILSAIDFGYSVTNKPKEIIEEGDFAGKIGLKDLKTKLPDNFSFKTDQFGNILPRGILQMTSTGLKDYPREEFIIYSYGGEFQNPYGLSDCRRCFRAWNSKRHILRFWDIYLERFAGGFVVGRYKLPIKKEDHDNVKKIIKNIQNRTGILIPENYALELIEAGGRGAESFENSIKQKNISMARAVLVPDLLGFSEKPTGSYSLGKKHFDVFLWVLEDLGRDIEETIFGEQVIKELIDLNFSDHGGKYPRFEFEPLSLEQKIQILSTVISAVDKGILEPDEELKKWTREALTLPPKSEEEGGESPALPRGGPGSPMPPDNPDDLPEDDPILDHKHAKKIVVRRGLTKFEKKVNFDAIISAIQELEHGFVRTWSEYFAVQRDALLRFARDKKIVAQKRIDLVQGMKMPRMEDIQKSTTRFLTASFYFGALQAQEEIERTRKNESTMQKFELDLDTIPINGIEKKFRERGLIVTAGLRDTLEIIKAESFWITGAPSKSILSEAQGIIFKGIRKRDTQWTEKELSRLFNGYIETGEIRDKALGTSFRTETIARTNFTSAIAEGRRAYFEDPDVSGYIEAYQWSSVLDDGTTPYCEDMDGRVLRKEDVDAIGHPPAHYNCRSMIVPVVSGESYSISPPTKRDRQVGFNRNERLILSN